MKSTLLLFVTAVTLFSFPNVHFGQAPNLGVTSTFALFTAAGAIDNLGPTVVTGDVGTNIGAFNGFPPGIIVGATHVADPVSAQAAVDVAVAYAALAGLTCGAVLGTTLGNGQILTPNIYCLGAASVLDGNLTLDAAGIPGAIFIFQIDGALSTTALSTITLINGANLCNVYFQVNGAVALGRSSFFQGNIVAAGAISFETNATLLGRALTTMGAISMLNNMVNIGACAMFVPPTVTCPPPVTVSCASQVPAPNPASVTVVAACPGPVMVTSSDVITNQTCANRFTITRTYTVTDACGNRATCTQTITVFDNTPPTITCPAGATVQCAGQIPQGSNTAVGTIDNCGGPVTVTFADVITNQTCANRFTLTRTYTATDVCGNAATCAQIFTVFDNTPPTIACPANATVSCVPATNPASVVTSDNCGGPVTVTSSDVTTNQTCANRLTITRTFMATDVCGNVATCAQIITVFDNVPPAITCPANVTVSCISQAPADPSSVGTTDNCGGLVTVIFVGDVISNQTCPGRFTVTRTYRATDVCGNFSTCTQTITVNDQTPPVIVTCPANVTVSCTSQIPVANPASVTTTDNCGGLGTVVLVGDVISNQICANWYTVMRTYRATDLCGNFSTCTQIITVNDLTPPVFTILPQDLQVECTAGYDSEAALADWLARFGSAEVSDQCSGAVLINVVLISDLPSCGGTFTRTYEFQATDACGNTSSVRATFSVVDTTPPIIICPPGNILLTCPADIPAPNLSEIVASDECGNVTVTVTISSVGTGCLGYTMTTNYWYMATDACGNMSNCDVSFQAVDSIPPMYTGPDTLQVSCVDDLPGPGEITDILAPYMTDNCSEIICIGRVTAQNGLTSVTYRVKAKDLCGNWTDKFTVTFVANGVCQPLCTATQTTWGDPASAINGLATTAAIEQLMGEHGGVRAGKLGKTVTATSLVCLQAMLPGNGTTAQFNPGQYEFSAANNCQPASPLLNADGTLKNKLAANVMAMQMNIWYNLRFNNRVLGVQSVTGLPACLVDPVVLNKLETDHKTVQGLLNLSNDYLAGVGFFPQGFGTLLSEALDNLNQYWQNCQINNPCSITPNANASVAGALKTETEAGLEEVEVSLVGSHPDGSPISAFDLTDEQGKYLFSDAIPMASNLTVTPAKNDNPLNGVTTYDLALISKHILGLQPLGSPYKMIAADANMSGSITAFDIVELRKLILGIYQTLPNNTSWRFVDKSFAFPEPANPFQTFFPENKTVANIQASQLDDDFVAIKIGDVNQNAIANTQQVAEERTAGTLLIDVMDRTVQVGETFTVTFKTAEAVQGFQFTLNLNGLTVIDIVAGEKVGADNFGVFLPAGAWQAEAKEGGVLTVSVDGTQEFTVRFRAVTAGQISDMLSVSSQITKAEGYTLAGERQEVVLRFRSPVGMTTTGLGFELYQNVPNPFVNQTLIGFHLPQATQATLTVYDETGQLVYTKQGDYAKGYHTITLEYALLNTTGLLYYKLKTATDVATKKMIQSKQ